MTVVVRSPGRLMPVLAIGASATIMIAGCTSSPTEQGVNPEDGETQTSEQELAAGAEALAWEEELAAQAIALREDVAITATATATEPKSEQWLLDATVTRQGDSFQIAGLKISWDLPGDAQVTDFEGECTPLDERQTCLTSSNLFGGFDAPLHFELIVDLPTSTIDRTVIVTVTHQDDRHDTDPANNTTTLQLE